MERIGAHLGGLRREWLFLPAPAGAPLVVFLTGTGGTAAWADRETGWSKLAAREGFALAIPEALPPNPAAAPSFLVNPPRWNDGSARAGDGRRATGEAEPVGLPLPPSSFLLPPSPFPLPPSPDDVAFVTAVIDDATARCGADPRRVFVTGFSNGAGMAFRLAAERAERVAAVAPVAGYCWVREPKPARPVPTMYAVGTRDLLIPLRGGDVRLPWGNRLVRRPPVAETLERWAAALGCSPVPVLQRDDGAVRVDRYPGLVVFDAVTVEGLGHHWPGGGGQLNTRTAGPVVAAADATAMIWDFFSSHTL